MEDHNARVIVLWRDGAQAKAVTDAIATQAWHNVSYFVGLFDRLRAVAVR